MIPSLMLAAATAASPTLQDRVSAIAAEGPGRIGMAAALLPDGPAVDVRGAEAFRAQSVYKLPIALAALAAAERGRRAFDAPVPLRATDVVAGPFPSPTRDAFRRGARERPLATLVADALAMSDNTASDALLRLAGGPAAVEAHMVGLRLPGFAIGTPLRTFDPDRNRVTPRAAVRLLGALVADQAGSPAACALVRDGLTRCRTGPGRIKGLLPAGTPVAHKTGTSGTWGGVTLATNDVGVVTLPDGRRFAFAAFVGDARATEARCERAIARLARAVYDAWAPAPGPRQGAR